VTPRGLIRLALKDAGVLGKGQSADPSDTSDAFTTLNQMISDWARQRWMLYQLVDLSLNSTGAQTYSIGPAGDFNVTQRPNRLRFAYVRQTNLPSNPPQQPDQPLDILTSREDYSRIILKNMGPYPYVVFYDMGWPLGTLYFWPVPQSGIYQLHIVVEMVLARFTSLNQSIVLPEEYEGALRYNLASRLLATYPVPPKPKVEQLARMTLDTIRTSNVSPARLVMPPGLVKKRGIYNIYADQQR